MRLLRRRPSRSTSDAAHPQYNTRTATGWIATGHLRRVKTTAGRQRVNLNAALNVHEPTDVACIESKRIDADSTIALFEQLEARHPEGRITVICDNARYYQCRKVEQWLSDHRVEVVYLPAYSPNLNLIERLWKYLRQTVLDTTYYETLAGFRTAIRSFFETIDHHAEALRSLMTPNFHIQPAHAE